MANIKDQVIYIGPNWTIVEDPDDAIMVKIISPDGSIKFGIPVDEDNVDELSELGGPGSGYHGHKGRPGKVGGSVKLRTTLGKFSNKKAKILEEYRTVVAELREKGMLDNVIGNQQIGSFKYKEEPGDLDMIFITEGPITEEQDKWNWENEGKTKRGERVNIFFAEEGDDLIREMIAETEHKYGK